MDGGGSSQTISSSIFGINFDIVVGEIGSPYRLATTPAGELDVDCNFLFIHLDLGLFLGIIRIQLTVANQGEIPKRNSDSIQG